MVKPLYTDSLNSWVGHIPEDVENDMAKIAPMLKILGNLWEWNFLLAFS